MIEIDEDDSVELLFLDTVADKSNKGKAVKVVSDGKSDYQTKVCDYLIKICSFSYLFSLNVQISLINSC